MLTTTAYSPLTYEYVRTYYYHVTDRSNLKSILTYGIRPKLNRRTKRGKRVVWLTDSMENAKRCFRLNTFSSKHVLYQPIVLILDMSSINVTCFRKCSDGLNEFYCTVPISPRRVWKIINI